MKRIMKKMLAVLLCICTAGMLLTGCSEKPNGTLNQNLTDDESEHVTLDYWIAVESASVPKDLSLVEAAINEIVEPAINATIKLHAVIVSEYESRMQLMINAGDDFDLCFTSPWLNKYSRCVNLGGFCDITDLLPEYAPETWSIFDEDIWEAARIDGRIYGSINRQIMPRTAGVSLDKEMFERSGMTEEDLQTLDGLTKYLEFCADNGADMTNLTQGFDPQALMALLQYNDLYGANTPGVIDLSEDGEDYKVVNQFETDAFREALKYPVEWYKKGYINKDVLTKSFDFSSSYGMLMSTWKPSGEGEDTARRNGRETVCIAIGPSINYSNLTASTMTAVSATSENPIRAVKFIELLNTNAELYNLLAYGVEGRHYNKIDDNHIELIADSGYSVNVAWEFGDQFQSYLLPGYADDVWEQTDKVNNEAVNSPVLGFTFDPSAVEVEITSCQSVYAEYWTALVSGVYGEDTDAKLEEFISRLKESGSDVIIAEMQRQVDEWVAAR